MRALNPEICQWHKDKGLLYGAVITEQLVAYMDVDWVGNAGDHRSTLGLAFSLGHVTIAWSSKKQPVVAISSTEAEYREVVVTEDLKGSASGGV